MGIHITWQDVPGFTSEDAWRIEDAEALAALAAPCLSEPTSTNAQAAQVKAILRAALMRWKDGGTGARTSQTDQAGPWSRTFTTDTREWNSTKRGVIFTADELAELRSLCGARSDGAAFSIDMTGGQLMGGPTLSTRPDLWFQWVHPTPDGAP